MICFDSEPDKLLGNQMQRDQSFEADDRFMFAIDPFLDGRTGYFFEINPSGAMGDGLITSPTGGGDFGGEMQKSWDGIWLARVRRTSAGWTAEIEVPFKTVNFDPDTDTWGANFQRTVKRKNEESLWTGWLRDEGLTRMSNAGRIGGIERHLAGDRSRSEAVSAGRGRATRRGEMRRTRTATSTSDSMRSTTSRRRSRPTSR